MTRTERFATGTILTAPNGDFTVVKLICRGGDGTEVQDMELRNAAGQTQVIAICIIEDAIEHGTMSRKGE